MMAQQPQPPVRPPTSRGRRRADINSVGEPDSDSPRSSQGRYSGRSSVDQTDLDLTSSRFSDVLTLDSQLQKINRSIHSSHRTVTDETSHSASSNHNPLSMPHSPLPTNQQMTLRRQSSIVDGELPDTRGLPSRPGSSRYRVLPAINNMSIEQSVTSVGTSPANKSSASRPNAHRDIEQIQSNVPRNGDRTTGSVDGPGRTAPSSKSGRSPATAKSTTADRLQVGHQPVQQATGEEHVLIAVKIPSGERLQRHYRPTDRLQSILAFVESEVKNSFKGCEFVRADTRQVLSDLRATIQACGIENRSVLFLQLPETR